MKHKNNKNMPQNTQTVHIDVQELTDLMTGVNGVQLPQPMSLEDYIFQIEVQLANAENEPYTATTSVLFGGHPVHKPH